MITLKVDTTEVRKQLATLAGRCDNLTPVMKRIGSLIRASVRENFKAGGRPEKWKTSKRAEGQRGQTLRDKNILYNSFTIQAGRSLVAVGTNVDYAAAHHFGVNKAVTQLIRNHQRRINQAFGKPIEQKAVQVKAHTRKFTLRLPARPFMLVQDEDWADISEAIEFFLLRGRS